VLSALSDGRPAEGLPRRVLMTTDAVGGVWTYALDLAAGLSRAGIETCLAVLGPAPDADQRRAVKAVPGLAFVETGLPLDWTAPTPDLIRDAGAAVADLAHDARADLVHLNSPALAADNVFPAPVVAVAHSCVATWWAAVKHGPLPDDFTWRAAMVGEGYQAADAVIAPSLSFAEATRAAYALPYRPSVVRNGRRAAATPGDATPGRGASFAFTAGRLWDEGKNLGMLDRAAARLSVPVFAAGPLEGPNGTAIALEHVETLGRLTDHAVSRWLAAAPVFVSTAFYEPFGLAVLEAAQAGCPLVLSDIPTFRELWDGAALFVDPNDPADVAGAVRHMLREPDERRARGSAARERAAHYGVAVMAAGTLEVYREAMRAELVLTKEEAA
jgi:glycosyltransferase involved in cell wall biosynthesis